LIKDAVRERREADAAQAWSLARAARSKQDWVKARLWYARARRLAPNDPRPALELAMLLAVRQSDEALDIFRELTDKYDSAAGWMGLASLYHKHGRAHEAAAALGFWLSRMEVPDAPEFAPFANAVAQAAGYAGWCGIGANLKLRFAASLPVSATLDGKAFRIPVSGILPCHEKPLHVAVDGGALLGSPIDLVRISKVEGIVCAVDGGLAGWAMRPASPDKPPVLYFADAAGRRRRLPIRTTLEPMAEAPFQPRYGFAITRKTLARLTPPFIVSGADGRSLYGAPITPLARAFLPVPADFVGAPPVATPSFAPLAIVVPVYGNAALTQATLESLSALHPQQTPIFVVDDASPAPDLRALLNRQARQGRIRLIHHRINRGFPAAANSGIRAARKHLGACDILLLNADTLMPPDAAARLHQALYQRVDIASITPFSNEATILSYPKRNGGNPAPDLEGTAALDRLARANRDRLVEIPTAIGFCMAIRHDCLKVTGLFREDVFAQGYGEENDWSLRARHRGFRHFALSSCFVAHHGGASFGAAGRALASRNIGLLNQLHPGYDQLIAAHAVDDPLHVARRRLDEARFRAGRKPAAVALISHDHGGGVARVIETRMTAIRREGLRPILLQPDFSGGGEFKDGIGRTRMTDGASDDYPNLCFTLPREFPALLRLLRREAVRAVEFHHGLGHHPLIRSLGAALAVPVDHVAHDYASFCKRINLIGAARRYCGEPDASSCVTCVESLGAELTDPIDPLALRARSAAEFQAARQIIVPSHDAAKRLVRHFPGIRCSITPWEDDAEEVRLIPPPPSPKPRRIALIGGIGPAKGYDVLMECARDAAARRLDLRFVVIGVSEDDGPLIETGHVEITGPYQEGEALRLIHEAQAELAFLPSIWPESWCFALTEAWRGGLYTLAFDLGAPAERIRATKRGDVLPLGLPPARINEILLAWQPNFGNFNLKMNYPRALQSVHA
jgi:GT2 family glycosyltransferase